jgi:hypothetical protein
MTVEDGASSVVGQGGEPSGLRGLMPAIQDAAGAVAVEDGGAAAESGGDEISETGGVETGGVFEAPDPLTGAPTDPIVPPGAMDTHCVSCVGVSV